MTDAIEKNVDNDDAIRIGIEMAERNKEALSELLMDPLVLKLVSMTIGRNLTVQDISVNLNVSIVTSYNLVKKMRGLGILVEIGGSRTSTRGVSALYTSIIRSGSIQLKDTAIELQFVFKDGSQFTIKKQVFNQRKIEVHKRKHRPLEAPALPQEKS
jgi:hypothetical protein